MRDILLVAFFFVAVYYAFRRPYLGVAAWIWIALTAPAEWVFGFSQSFRLNLTIVLVTMVAYLSSDRKEQLKPSKILKLVLFFWFWTLISTLFNDSTSFQWVFDYWIKFSKIVLLFIFVILTLRSRLHIDTIIWAVVLSISSYAAMEGVKFILSAGGHRIVGRAGIISDRNDLAVAINMCIPLLIYLNAVTKHKLLKQGLWVLIALNLIAVVGTYSRGGFIGLSILGFALWMSSRYKIVIAVVAMIALPTAYGFAPEEWRERQTTISTAAAEDSSFIGRLWAWKISTLIAIGDPITGGGFGAVTERHLWRGYAPYTPDFGPITTPPIPDTLPPKAAHNIYFQVLGDHGFVGLAIFLSMLGTCFFTNLRNIRAARDAGVDWFRKLASALNLTFVGYGITGMNVSLAYFDLLYALVGVVAVMTMWRTELLTTSAPHGANPAVGEKKRAKRGRRALSPGRHPGHRPRRPGPAMEPMRARSRR